jgi:hypothetical protein
MIPNQLSKAILDWTVEHSGYEDRHYLGMSRIADCSRRLYFEMSNGRPAFDLDRHLMCYLGYLFEADVKRRLEALNLYRPGSERELVANFDPRFRGHTDGELVDGSLLEIKSMLQPYIDQIRQSRRLPVRHFQQVQVYLRHGGYNFAHVIYVARDTGQIYTAGVRIHPATGDRLDRKAVAILRAVDANEPPECECGRCDVN